nr:hypothetical protein [uncultured Draconibacterium sp.]
MMVEVMNADDGNQLIEEILITGVITRVNLPKKNKHINNLVKVKTNSENNAVCSIYWLTYRQLDVDKSLSLSISRLQIGLYQF